MQGAACPVSSHPPFRTGLAAFTASGCWVRTRRSTLRSVSSSSPFRTVLATFTAHGSAPSVILHGHITTKRSFAFPQLSRVHSPVFPRSCVQLARSLDIPRLHRDASSLSTFAPVFPKARGLRHWALCPVRGFPTLRLLRPFRHFPKALGFRETFPPLYFPTSLGIPRKASRVRHVGLKRNDVGGVFLRAPSALSG